MTLRKFINSFLLIFSLVGAATFAQTASQIKAYNVGEKLTYEAKFSKTVFRGVSVGDLSFTVTQLPDVKDLMITSEARSKGTIVKLINVFANKDFFQHYKSTVDGTNFSIKRTVKRDEQGERVRESEALFDYAAKKVIYVETDPNDAARPPRQMASPISADTQDLITAIYTIRRLPLAVGKTFELTVSDSGLVYKIPVRVVAREQQKSVLGRTWCFRVVPELFGANRLIDQKGEMNLWITDDARRLPVRSQVNLSIGRFEVKLKKFDDDSSAPTKKK